MSQSVPLAGVKVLDLTLNLPGPYATWTLACLGADVVKLEPPKGDPARHMGALFHRLNRGKRSVVVDLRSEQGQREMAQLVDWADVLVEGFRPGVMERLGWGPDVVHGIDPRVVFCRITAFGQTGPRRLQPGHDLNLQALTGLCHLEGGAGPPRAGMLPIADLACSLAAVAAISAGLAGDRDRQVLDVAMADAALSFAWTWDSVDPGVPVERAAKRAPLGMHRLLEPLRRRLRAEKLYSMPQYGLYRARDGWIAVGIVEEPHFWESFADQIGLRHAREWSLATRTVLRPLLRRQIARRIARKPVSDWVLAFETAGVPVTAVLSPTQAVAEPQFSRVVKDGWVIAPIPGAVLPPEPAPGLGDSAVSQVIATPR